MNTHTTLDRHYSGRCGNQQMVVKKAKQRKKHLPQPQAVLEGPKEIAYKKLQLKAQCTHSKLPASAFKK